MNVDKIKEFIAHAHDHPEIKEELGKIVHSFEGGGKELFGKLAEKCGFKLHDHEMEGEHEGMDLGGLVKNLTDSLGKKEGDK